MDRDFPEIDFSLRNRLTGITLFEELSSFQRVGGVEFNLDTPFSTASFKKKDTYSALLIIAIKCFPDGFTTGLYNFFLNNEPIKESYFDLGSSTSSHQILREIWGLIKENNIITIEIIDMGMYQCLRSTAVLIDANDDNFDEVLDKYADDHKPDL